MIKIFLIFLIFGAIAVDGLAQDSHEQMRKGDKLYKKEQFEEAAKVYGKVVEEETDNVQALYNSGVAEAKNDNKEDALQYFAKAAEMANNQHDKASALYNAGTLLLTEKDKIDESIELLKEALRNSPKDMDIRKNLAKALQMKRLQQKQEQQKQQEKDKNQDKKDKKQQDDQQDKQEQDKQEKDEQQNKDKKDQQEKENEQGQDNPKDKEGAEQEQKKQQDFDKNQQKQDTKKPMSIEKQKALQKLKSIESAERNVRMKIQKLKGKNSNRSGKNW